MELGIYSKDGRLKLSVAPGDNGACSCGIQEESILAVSFTAFECIALEVYDYADFEGRRYWILERYLPQMNARREWAYSIRMSGAEGLAGQTLMVNPEDDDNPVLTLSAPAREHAALIVANMNRRTGTTEWKVGEVVVSEYIDIEYTGKYASDALSELSAAAKTEWWFDGMTLNISRCEFGECIPLSYGNGLIRNISRNIAEGVKFFTRLFPVGSSRNIDPDKYGHSRLQLPGGIRYVEQDTDLGIIEHFEQEAFERIFPRRIGTVGVVRHEERIGEDGKPFTVWYFTDPEIPFDPNQYEIGGLVKRITFQSGELLGREFEVNYDSQKKEFEIITQWPYDDDMQLPSEPLIPASGDEYVLWNISMPESYYPAAEQEFKTAVDTFMSENRKDVSVFQAQTDFTVIDQRALDLRPGQRIRLESAEYFPDTGFRETRIVSISRSVVRPGSMTLKMSDVLSTGRISRIESNIASVERLTKQVSSEFPDIIRSWEETPASDTTLYSSRKSEREFLNKRRGGTVEADVIFDKDITIGGSVVSKDFRQGDFSGSGFGAYRDENGNAVVEADILKIRKEAIFNEAVINQVTFRVGATVFSNGGCEITRVEELETAFRCYYDNREGRRYSGLTAGDQVRCQRYDPTQHAIIKYYWRLVTAVGEDYVELSKSDADGSASPEAGDEIAQFGNRSDITRQSAIVINPLDGGSVEVYAHIDAYSLSEKNYVGMGVNPQTGEAYMYAYGDMFFGDRDLADPNASWITYQKKEGEERRRLRIKADVTFGADSSGLGNLSEFKAQQQQIDNAQQTADDAQTTANEAQQAADEAARKAQEAKDYINSTLPGELAEINKKLDGVVENWFYDYTPTLENEPAASWIRDGEQAKHEGDTFTNTQEYVDNETTPDAGKSWRWVKDGSTWKWTPIADSDAVKALQQAAKAQETADGKNSNFVVQPTPPYAVGDFWSQGEGGQIMRCIKARASGSFDASDWAPAGDYYKYTDDKVDGIQIGSVNLIDGSERMVVPMGYGPNNFKAWPLGAVEAGERYAVSVESVELLTGDAVSGFDVQIWNSADGNVTTEASNRLTFPVGGPYTGVFEITATSSQAMLVLYSGVKTQAAGRSVAYNRLALVRGNKPALSWSPSIADQEKYTDDKVDGIQIGSVNLLDGSREFTVTAGSGDNYKFQVFDIGEVEAGEVFALSVENISVLAGTPGELSVRMYNEGASKNLANYVEISTEERTALFTIKSDVTKQKAKVLFYAGKYAATAGNSVRYEGAVLVRGNKPALSWSPSIADQEKYTDDKVDGIQIGSVNLLDGSREFTVTAGSGDNYKFQVFDIGEVEAGEVFALSVENISVLAGTPGELSVRMYNEGASKNLANYVEISTEERTALFTIKSDVTKQKAKVLFYAGKYAATAGNSVRYEGAVLVRGNKPALSWSPSIADQEKYADQAVNGVETLIDASKLDQNTYYPVTIKLNGIARSKITVRVNLSDTQPGKPVWGTYNENRFSCQAVWYNNGNSWGSNYDKRIIEEYQYRWANYRPIGSVGQMGNSSNEYIYVRGGGVYRFFATNAGTPVLHTEAYTVNEQTIDLKTSVEPLVSLQEQANSTQQEAETTRKAIADMNDDTIFDVSEKQSIRTQWENISGYARTDVVLDSLSATNGSYYRVRDMAKAAGISTAGLLAAVNSLRVKLNDYALYTASNTPGFDRAGLAVLFTAYYAQEIDVLNAVSRKYTDGKVADIETSMQDYDYLKLVFPNNTVDNNGVFLSRLMAVKNGTSASAAVVAGLYGGGVDSLNNAGFKDATHGILMMFAGATSIQNVAAAKTRIYGDGTLYTSKLVAQAGTIAGFTIGTGYIGSENLTGSEYFYLSSSVIKNGKKDTYAMIGDTMYREKWKVAATLYNHYGSTGIGLVVDMGDNSHAAIYVPNGTFSGFRPMSRSYDNGTYTLHGNEEETVFFVNTSKGSTTFYLPSNPQPDQRYEIRKLHSGNRIIINAQNNGDIYVTGSNNPSSQISWTGRRCVTIQYSKNLDAWVMWFSYEA